MEVNELKVSNNYQSIIRKGSMFVIETYDNVNFEIAICPVGQIENLSIAHRIKANSDVDLQEKIGKLFE